MKNIEEKILMAEEEIKQLQNKRKKLISQQKQEEIKKRDRRIYEKGAVFESIFTESKEFSKSCLCLLPGEIDFFINIICTHIRNTICFRLCP